jgi:hypothetical protein
METFSVGDGMKHPRLLALGQILLNETRTEMDINLDEWPVSDATEAVDLSRLDNEDVTGAGLEFLPVDCPETPPFPDELDFIVGMTMRPGPLARQRAEKEDRDVDIAVIGPDEFMRTAVKRKILLTNAVHRRFDSGRSVTR